MTEDAYFQADPELLHKNAVTGMKEVIEDFDNYKVDAVYLLMTAQNVWHNLNRNVVMKQKLDDEIARQQKAVDEITVKGKSEAESVRDRYNPESWIYRIPVEMENDKYTYLRDKAQSFLGLLEAIK